MPMFRKKPVVVEAMQYTGENFDEIATFLGPGVVTRLDATDHLRMRMAGSGNTYVAPGYWILTHLSGHRSVYADGDFQSDYEEVPA